MNFNVVEGKIEKKKIRAGVKPMLYLTFSSSDALALDSQRLVETGTFQ